MILRTVNLMKIYILGSSVVLLSSLLVTGFVGASFSQNQTNMTSMQGNQTQPQQKQPESGNASGIENLTGVVLVILIFSKMVLILGVKILQ